MRVTSTKEEAKLKMEYRGVAMRPIVKEEQIFLKTKLQIKNEHCQGPSPDSLNARKFKKNVKERAKLSHDKPKAVRRELQIEFPLESAVELPLPGATRKMVIRIRATAHFHMPTPKILADVADIPESLKVTHGGEEFLHYDSGSHDPERLLIFARPSNLGVLDFSERWYCDGTFSTSPDVFYQVYTIHGEVSLTNTYIIPLVYALLPNKKQETYSRLFKALILNASSVTIDFEIAVRNALKQISTDVQISFC